MLHIIDHKSRISNFMPSNLQETRTTKMKAEQNKKTLKFITKITTILKATPTFTNSQMNRLKDYIKK